MQKRILLVHNLYQQAGGEDRVVEAEAGLLRRHGHQVFHYTDDNARIADLGTIRTAAQTIWSHTSYRKLLKLIRDERIELCHFHNTFPLISPSGYYAARRAGVPVVQTLHNYRLLCSNAVLMRNGAICEDCLGRRVVWPGAIRRCYRHSYSASTVAAGMISTHRLSGTYRRAVKRYIALTQFAKGIFIKGGLPPENISVKPNFVEPDPGCGNGDGGYALFVGRLSPEKGIDTILKAWSLLQCEVPLHIAGVGPLAQQVKEYTAQNPAVRWLGQLSRDSILAEMKAAKFLVCPSIWYESFPLTIVEAFSTGLPVIASNVGALSELIDHERTGLLFRTGDAADLAAKVQWAMGHLDRLDAMRSHARGDYESRYMADTNYRALMAIYEKVWNSVPEEARTQPRTLTNVS